MGRRWRPDGRDPPIVWRVRMPVRGSAVRLPFAFPARLGVAEAGLGSSLVHGCFRAESTADVGKENRAGRWPQRAVAPPCGHAGGGGAAGRLSAPTENGPWKLAQWHHRQLVDCGPPLSPVQVVVSVPRPENPWGAWLCSVPRGLRWRGAGPDRAGGCRRDPRGGR